MSRRKGTVLIVVLGLLILALVWLGIALGRLYGAARAVQDDLHAVESMLAKGSRDLDPREAIGTIHALRVDLEALDGAARPFLWLAPYLGWIPRYGPDMQAAPGLIKTALDLAIAGEEAATPLLPVLVKAVDGDAPDPQALLPDVLQALQTARPKLLDALSAVRRAQAWQTEVRTVHLSPRVRAWVDRLDRYLPVIERGVVGGLVLPVALGTESPQTYLILVQNEDELRATGGLVSGVARVTVAGGRLLEVSFEDSYALDDFARPYPDPPAPLLEYMLSELWVFRDSNWSPDYPTSAQSAIDLYAITRDGDVDGVIALDQRAIVVLVDAIGPLDVAGSQAPVTGKNVTDLARQAWGTGKGTDTDWWRHRKDFMGAVLHAAARRIASGLTQSDVTALGRVLAQVLDERQLLVYLEDQQAATWLNELRWDGAVRVDAGDYLMVVDTNMGFNKANALVQERLEYVVDLSDPDQPVATLTVVHRHTLARLSGPCRHEPRYDETYEQLMARCYWDYLRVYVPVDARLLDATPHAVSGTALLSGRPSPAEVRVGPPEQGRNVFATFFLLRPQEALETRFEYALPDGVLRRIGTDVTYCLVVQKQPGTHGVPLDFRLLLPEGAQLVDSSPEPEVVTSSELAYALSLAADQTLHVTMRLHR